MIRNKLDYSPDMEVNEFRARNEKYLKIIHDSIRNNHDYSTNNADEYNASVLFLSTTDQESEHVKNQPVWKPKQKPE